MVVGTVRPDTYLITKDIVLTLKGRYGLKLSDQQTREIRTLEDEFLAEFWRYVPKNSKAVSIDAENLQKRLNALISAEELPVVTLDDIYVREGNPCVVGALSVTRLTDPQTKQIIGLGPRPGKPPLEEQIAELANQYKSICLADIGAFEGPTLIKMIDALKEAGIKVPRAYLGVWGKQAVDAVNGAVDAYVLKTFNFYEWIELRDFFGIDGRKSPNGSFMPFWVDPQNWASIPNQNNSAVRRLCLEYSRKLMDVVKSPRLLIFDMDGTLYKFNGNGFYGSTFWDEIKQRCSDFLSRKLTISKPDAEVLRDNINSTFNGDISLGVEKQFGINRYEYFGNVWNIDAEKYLKKDNTLRCLLESLPQRKVVLTTAPRVWAAKVLKTLGIDDLFDDAFTGEGDIRKPNTAAFTQILEKYEPEPGRAMSIGDQVETDIKPAKQLGMQVFEVNDTNRLYDLQKAVWGYGK